MQLKFSKNLISMLLLICFVLCLLNQAFAGDWWDIDWSYRRKVTFNETAQKFPESPGGNVILALPGRAFNDARDLRVVGKNGKILKHQIVWTDESDICEIIYETKDEDYVYVYWGNNAAKKQEKSEIYNPKMGLILETMEKPDGSMNSWEEIEDLISRSSKIYGRSVHPKVFDGFNPFGPSDNYISHYSGWLTCPEKGIYTFYTASDDASVLMIHNQTIVEWLGIHKAQGGVYGEHSGQVYLKPGVYKFDYYHVEGTHSQACVAGWRLPSKLNLNNDLDGIGPITEKYFGGFKEGSAQGFEKFNKSATVDFNFEFDVDMYINDNDSMVQVNFNQKLNESQNFIDDCKFYWDFGDGNQGKDKTTSHIFFTAGVYPVTLRVTHKKKLVDELIIKIKITPIWSQISRVTDKFAEKFFRKIKDYEIEKMSLQAARNFLYIADLTNNYDAKFRGLKILLKKSEKLTVPELAKYRIEIAILEAYINKDEEASESAFKQAEKLVYSKAIKLYINLKEAELKFKIFENFTDARKILNYVKENLETLSSLQKQVFYLISGDFERMGGNLKKAREFYDLAAKTSLNKLNVDEILIADTRIRINSCIRAGNGESACALIDYWKSILPNSYIDSDLAFLEIKALLTANRFYEAEAQANIVFKGQASNNWVGDILYILGEFFWEQGSSAKAKNYLSMLTENYKENPKTLKALKILNKIK